MSSQAEKFLKIVAILAMACTTTSAARPISFEAGSAGWSGRAR